MTIATVEPEKIIAGDTLQFTKAISDYEPADGWALSYALVKDAVQITFTSSDNGDGSHLVTVAAATTAAYTAGVYKWQSYVTKTTERFAIDSGTMEVTADYATETGGLDARAHCKKMLDALEAMLEGKATRDQQSYSISFGDGGASRSISRLSFGEIMEARKFYKNEYQRLLRQEKLAAGLDSGRTIHVRMGV